MNEQTSQQDKDLLQEISKGESGYGCFSTDKPYHTSSGRI